MRSYSSDLNIGIGQMPDVKDNPQLFGEMQMVYNALHLLNDASQRARDLIQELNESLWCQEGDSPWECMGTRNRSFWAPVNSDVKEGRIVRPGTGETWRLGATSVDVGRDVTGTKEECIPQSYGRDSGRKRVTEEAEVTSITQLFAIALTDAKDGMALLGIPTIIVEAEGMDIMGTVYADGQGKMFINNPNNDLHPVGRVVAENSLMLIQSMVNTRSDSRVVDSWKWAPECGWSSS